MLKINIGPIDRPQLNMFNPYIFSRTRAYLFLENQQFSVECRTVDKVIQISTQESQRNVQKILHLSAIVGLQRFTSHSLVSTQSYGTDCLHQSSSNKYCIHQHLSVLHSPALNYVRLHKTYRRKRLYLLGSATIQRNC